MDGGARHHPLQRITAITSDDSHTPFSHRAHADVPLDVRKHSDHSGPGDSQRRAADNLPQQPIGLLPAANAEGVNIYIESHRYQPPFRKTWERRPSMPACLGQSAIAGSKQAWMGGAPR